MTAADVAVHEETIVDLLLADLRQSRSVKQFLDSHRRRVAAQPGAK
jgi:hypothetical protein